MMLWLLLLVPVFTMIFRVRLVRQRRDVQGFGVGTRRSENISMEPWRLALLVLSTVTIILALTRPAINPHPERITRDGRDVVFMLDVSKSMLAEDRLPNRLASAKASIAQCVESLDDHRVGLVVFAGSSSIVCPLTMDTDFFLEALEKTGPDSVAHGGTRIGDALLKACDKLFSDSKHGYRDIVLLSDGGDQSEGVDSAVKQLNDKQVRLLAIGIGDEKVGARIPVANGSSDYLFYKNQEVWSKLDGALLSNLVNGCNEAAYIPVGTRQMALDQIYQRLSSQGGTQQLAGESVIDYDEIFHCFIAFGLFFLLLMALIPHTLKRPRTQVATVISSLAIIMLIAPQSIASEKAQTYYLQGNAEYRDGAYNDAALNFENALLEEPPAKLVRDITYNLGNTYFMASKTVETSYASLALVEQSIAKYRLVLLLDRNDQDAAINNEIARIERKKLQQSIKEQKQQQADMREALEKIRENLITLITQQADNLPKLEEVTVAPAQWDVRQKIVATETKEVSTLIEKYNETYFEGIPAEITPLKDTRAHVAVAEVKQELGLIQHLAEWDAALANGHESLHALQQALLALPQDPKGSGDPSEDGQDGEDGDTSDSSEDEGEGEEGESNGGEEAEMDVSEATKMDLDSIDLPPPSNSPEEIIRMSQEMQQARQAAGSKKKGTPVEKDW
ncbi:MAG: Ca-activated chloride channel family protein [Crocinitomicaceae bacterium]|jgi:Ca-activated chloride channel family protein